ncbi:MAG: glycosyltransferase family 2 protein [Chloroflexi bacterium]|jgi:dolichol-phosphate mannosyltransferase|nr:glycosyltransferase family 2 protein [Chloroflexota bacterium]
MSEPTFTVIAPIYNELENLPLLYSRVKEVMDQTGEAWELILVDDGSTDGSTDIIRDLAAQDERVRPVIFARNFGHQIAVTAGMDYSRGQAVTIIDADLQDPPEVILDLIEKWREGYQIVYAVRSEREGESWFKLTTASLFYKLIFKITDVKIPLNTGDFRLIDRKALNIMNNMRERNRFLRGMGAWVGFKQIGVEYKRHARHAGETHYPLRKMMQLALNAITGFSTYPLKLITTSGIILVGLSLVLLVIYLILAIANKIDLTYVLATWLTLIFLSGILLVGMGILGEYIGRLYDEAKGRPLYIVAEGPGDSLDPTRLDRPKK